MSNAEVSDLEQRTKEHQAREQQIKDQQHRDQMAQVSYCLSTPYQQCGSPCGNAPTFQIMSACMDVCDAKKDICINTDFDAAKVQAAKERLEVAIQSLNNVVNRERVRRELEEEDQLTDTFSSIINGLATRPAAPPPPLSSGSPSPPRSNTPPPPPPIYNPPFRQGGTAHFITPGGEGSCGARQSLAVLADEIKTYACRSGICRNLDPGRSAKARILCK